MRRNTLGLLSLLLLPLSLLTAQEDTPREIPFQVYLWPGGPNPNMEAKLEQQRSQDYDSMVMVEYVPPTIQFSPDGKGEEVQAVRAIESRPSPIYRYTGQDPLVFFREESIGEERIRRVPLGSVQIPKSIQRALLLFLPNPQNPNTYRIYPIDNSLSQTKPGEACVHNITRSTIGCLFNDTQILLKPGEYKVVPIGAEARISIVVRIAAQDDDGDWKQRHAKQISVQPDDSLTILIFNKPEKANAFRVLKLNNPKE